jgi:hypothetical protein
MNRNLRRALWTGLLAGLSCATAVRADETPQERRQRVEQMDSQTKQELLRRQERFDALEPEEKKKLHRLHEAIQNDPNRDELLRELTRYYDWLKTLTLLQQAELRELPPVERIRRIEELRAEQARRGSGRFGSRGFPFGGERFPIMPGQIMPADREHYLRWTREYADEHGRELFDKLPPDARQKLESQLAGIEDPERRQETLFWLIWLRWHLDHPGRSDFLSDEELDRLQAKLPADTQKQLAGLSPAERRARLFRSIRSLALNQYIMRRSEPVPAVVSRQELDEFFEKSLDPKQRDAMSTSSPQEMERRLFLHFLNSRLPEEARFGFGPGRPRRGGPAQGGPGPAGRGASHGPARPAAGVESLSGQSDQPADKKP